MLKLIIGVKGTGKTKTLIEMANAALEKSNGSVVCIEKGVKLRYEVKYQVRLINTNDYLVFDSQSLFGFISGILEGASLRGCAARWKNQQWMNVMIG